MYVRNFMEFRALMDQSTLYVLIKHDLTCLMRHFLPYDFPKRRFKLTFPYYLNYN